MPASSPAELAELMRNVKPTPAAPGIMRLVSTAQIDVVKTEGQPDAERWLLYSGIPCLTEIDGVNGGQPFWLVTDLTTLTAPARLKGFWNHIEQDYAIIGTWSSPTIDATGIRYGLELLQFAETEQWSFPYARQMRTLVANRFPLQASIGVEKGPQGRLVRLNAVASVNGRDIDPRAFDAPVLILYGGVLREASGCLFGADSNTGAGLTRHPSPTHGDPMTTPTNEPTADRLKVLLAENDESDHGLIAQLISQGKSDAEIGKAVHKAQLARKDAELARQKQTIAEKDTEIARLSKDGRAAKKEGAPPELPAGGGVAGEDEAPASMGAALSRHASELKGMPMAARLQRMHEMYPNLGAKK